jgi:hypothetical protein
MSEVAVAGLRAGAVAVLGIIALTGAAIAGMEKALTTPGPQYGQAEAGLPVSGPAAPALAAPGSSTPGTATRAPCAPPVRICVQLSGSTAWLLAPKGATLGPVPIRHGRPDSPTPSGLFPVEGKNAEHVQSASGSPMPFAIFFDGDLALYEADLSQPSAGSVRLPPGAAEQFFRGVSVGDLIQVIH